MKKSKVTVQSSLIFMKDRNKPAIVTQGDANLVVRHTHIITSSPDLSSVSRFISKTRPMTDDETLERGWLKNGGKVKDNYVVEVGLLNYIFDMFRYWIVRLLYLNEFRPPTKESKEEQ